MLCDDVVCVEDVCEGIVCVIDVDVCLCGGLDVWKLCVNVSDGINVWMCGE